MPFRHAHYYLLALIALTVVAFWPGYFSVLATAPWGFHFHGITATLWMLLLAFQSWSIHARHSAWHRTMGAVSLGFFPIFLAGGAAVESSMATATANGDLFYQMYGARLGIMDGTSIILLGYLFYKAIRHRRNVQLHARYLLATPLLLTMPIVGRAISHLAPPLLIHGPQDFPNFAWSIRWASVIGVALAAWLYSTAPKHGRPFLIAGIIIAVQQVFFDTIAYTTAWQQAFLALAHIPLVVVIFGTMLIGAGVSWAGWTAGIRRSTRKTPIAI